MCHSMPVGTEIFPCAERDDDSQNLGYATAGGNGRACQGSKALPY